MSSFSWPQPDPTDPFASLADLRARDNNDHPMLIQLTPYVPPPPRIRRSPHFPPPPRLRLIRSPSLSTITDRRESGGSYNISFPSSASSIRSSASSPHLIDDPSSSSQRRRSLSSDSDSTLSSDILEPVDIHQDIVQVQTASPSHSFHELSPALRRSSSLPSSPVPNILPPEPTDTDPTPFSTISSRRLRKKHPQPTTDDTTDFHPLLPPTQEQLRDAADLDIIRQDGQPVRFGSLFEHQKTIICFIRHFWCPLCQDYMYSVMREVDPVALGRAGVKLVVISHGSPAMIRAYRQIFRMPPSIPLFTDPSRTLYRALGMTLRTLDGGPEDDKGDYVRHGQLAGIGMVVKNAIVTRMPIYAKGGDVKQLGGEFILGPGLSCSYASRMHTTRSHTSISDLLIHAGVEPRPDSDHGHEIISSLPPTYALPPLFPLAEHNEDQMRQLRADICRRRMSRRGGIEHFRWVSDCVLDEEDEYESAIDEEIIPDDAQSDTEFEDDRPERVRRLSDPGPVAEWLAGMQAQRPLLAAELHQLVMTVSPQQSVR